MSAVVVDASVWVSRLLPQDANFEASARWLEGHLRNSGTIVGPTLLLAEVAGPIARRTGDPHLAEAAYRSLLRLPGFRLVPLDRRGCLKAAELAAALRLKGADAIYLALSQELGISLVTWDAEQLTRGSGVTSVLRPGD